MKSNSPDPSHFHPWKVAFRKNAHLLISAGYIVARSKIESDEHNEEHITEFIVCGMKDWMRRRDRPSWCKYYSVHEEAPVSRKGSYGKSRPRTDIFIEHERKNDVASSIKIYHILLDCSPPAQ